MEHTHMEVYTLNETFLAQLHSPFQITRSGQPKIQRVAHHLRNRKAFAEYYSPKMVSLGPIHHGEPHLELGEKYKLMWASMYVGGDRERAQLLHKRISENMEGLKDMYNEDTIGKFNNQQLADMLFLDGCALLQILQHPDLVSSDANVDQLALFRQDALLLENQIPFQVLQLLSHAPNIVLLKDMDVFLGGLHFSPGKPPQQEDPPAHLLDGLRRNMLAGFRHQRTHAESGTSTWGDLRDLTKAGIKVVKMSDSQSQCPIDITFHSSWLSGELRLPMIYKDNSSASTYLNLIAHEVCPGFKNNREISSYVDFVASMVKSPRDVKELRSCGCIGTGGGGDAWIAEFFNLINADLNPNPEIYAFVRAQIERYFKYNYRIWFAQIKNTYFKDPGSFIAFLAACALLILTFLQTLFTITCCQQTH